MAAHLVADAVARNGRHDDGGHHGRQRDVPQPGCDAANDGGSLAGDDEADEQGVLNEDDEADDGEDDPQSAR